MFCELTLCSSFVSLCYAFGHNIRQRLEEMFVDTRQNREIIF